MTTVPSPVDIMTTSVSPGNSMENDVTEPVQEGESQGPREVEDEWEWEASLHSHDRTCRKNPGHHNFIPIDQFNVKHLPPGCQDKDLVDLVRAVADLTVRVTVKNVSERRPETFPGSDKPYPMYKKRGSNTMMLGTGCVSRVKKYPYKLDNKGCEQCLNSPTPRICDCKKCSSSPISKTCKCKKCLNSPTQETHFAEIYIYTATHVVYDHLEAAHTTCHLFFDKGARPDLCSGVINLTEPSSVVADIKSDVCHLVFVTHDLELADKLESMVEQCRRSQLMSSINNNNLPLESKELSSSAEVQSLFDDLYKRSTFLANSDSMLRMHFPFVYGLQNNATDGQSLPDIIEDQAQRAKHFFQLTRGAHESGKQISQPELESATALVIDMLRPYNDLLFQGSGVNVDSRMQIQQPVLGSASGFVEDIMRPLNDLLSQITNMNVESEKQNPQSLVDAASGFSEDLMRPLNDLLSQITNMNVESEKQNQQPVVDAASGFVEDIMRPLNDLLSQITNMNVESEKQNQQPVVESASGFSEDLMRPLNNLLSQITNMNVESEKQNPQPVVESASDFVEDLMRPLKSLLDRRSGVNVESEKQSHQHETAESQSDSIEEIMHSLKHVYDQRSGMSVVDKQIVESMVEFTSDIFVKIIYPVKHLLSHRCSMDVDTKKHVLQSVLESTSDVIENMNHFWEKIYDQGSSMLVESEKQIPQPVVESESDLVEEIMRPLNKILSEISGVNAVVKTESDFVEEIIHSWKDLLDKRSGLNVESEKQIPQPGVESASGMVEEIMRTLKGVLDQKSGVNVESEKKNYQQETAESPCDSIEEIMHSLKHVYDQRSGMSVVDKQIVESMVEFTSDIFIKIIHPVKHLLSHRCSIDVDSKKQVLQSVLESTSDVIENMNHFWEKIYDQGSSMQVESEKQIPQPVIQSESDLVEEIMHPLKVSVSQRSEVNVESEKQISQLVVESESNLVEEIMHPVNDFLSPLIGMNADSGINSHRYDAAVSPGERFKEAMDCVKRFNHQEHRLNLELEKLSLQKTTVESRCDYLEEAMHSLKQFYDQRSGVNEVDKQFIESMVESTSDVLPKIIYPVRHLLGQGRTMNVESMEHVLQSMNEAGSDFLEKTINSWTNIYDKSSSMNADSDKPVFRFDVKLACDAFKDLLHVFRNNEFKKDLTSEDSESLCDVAGKIMRSFKPAFEYARNKNIESEKQRSQSQPDPWLALTIIVSHPHGSSKHVTIGQYTNCDGKSDMLSKFKYNTPTCPGSSGARVCVVGRDPTFLLPHHVHSGGSQKHQENFSAFGFDIPLD